jgi:transcriptional regulator GlxA family with amidase domain
MADDQLDHQADDEGSMKSAACRDFIDRLDGVGASAAAGSDGKSGQLYVGIILWPEFPLLSLTGIVEALRHAGDIGDDSRKVWCNWDILAASDAPVRSSCGIEVKPTSEFQDPKRFDCIFVIGGLLRSLQQGDGAAISYLRDARAAGTLVAGVCTGSFVMAQAGLLKNVACIHPYHLRDFQGRFPMIRTVGNQDYLWSEGVATIPGGTSIINFMADLIGASRGDDRASKVVHQMTIPERGETSATSRKLALGYSHVDDPRIKRAILLMERGMGENCSIADVAAEVGLSLRQFERLFTELLGVPPKRFLMATRLRYARWLVLQTAQTMSEIADQTGFADCSHFVRSFRSAFGTSPKALRMGQAA